MLIKAGTEQGAKAKIFKEDGTQVELPILEYDTDTQIIKHYLLEEDGRIKMGDWVHDEEAGKGRRKPLVKELHLPGSYAEIDGERV